MKKISTPEAELIDRIKMARGFTRKTQAEMAGALGISASLYSKIESGHRAFKDPALSRFCELCGVDKNWVTHGAGKWPGVEAIMRVCEPKAPYGDKPNMYLYDGWIEDFTGIVKSKQNIIETGCNEYGLNFLDAIMPAIREMSRALKGEQ